MYGHVQISDAFVDCVETLDVFGQGAVNEKCDASRHVVEARASEDVVVVFGGPKFVFVCAPRFVNGDDVPMRVLEFGE